MWADETERAKFWISILTELKNRGVKNILIACVDCLKGFPEAIEAVYPMTDATLHHPPGAAKPELRILEAAQGNG